VSILEHPQAQALLSDAVLDEDCLARLSNSLGPFLERYSPLLQRQEQRGHLRAVLEGKLSCLTRKTCEPIAHAAGLRRERLQDFVGSSPWDDEAVLAEMRRHITQQWADPQAILTIDGSGFPKKGTQSVGVQRQWCGRLGKIENCQVGVFLGYACARGHALLDRRLYLPQQWASDEGRREKAHVPEEVAFQEGWRIALALLDRCRDVPHAWVTADDEFGRVQDFRAGLRQRGERYVLDVPSDTSMRDLEEKPPVQARRRGSPPKAPFETVAEWAARQPAQRWRQVEARAGEKGPVLVWALTTRVQTTWERGRLGPEERLLVRRSEEGKISYHLSNAGAEATLEGLVRAKGGHHQMEQCFEEAKGEVGLGHYEVRSWRGWHHHMTLSLLALWFLALSRCRAGGENPGPDGVHPARSAGAGADSAEADGSRDPDRDQRHAAPQGGSAYLPLAQEDRRIPAPTRGKRPA
jgi:SRSO17 transposase